MKIIDKLDCELHVDTDEATEKINLLGDRVKELKNNMDDLYSTKTKLFKGLYSKIITISAIETAIIIIIIAAYVILH